MTTVQDPTECIPEDTKVEVDVEVEVEDVHIVNELRRPLDIAVQHIAKLEKRSNIEAKKIALETIRDLNEQLFTTQQQIAQLETENTTLGASLSDIQECIRMFETKEEAEADLIAANEKLASFDNTTAMTEHELLSARLRSLETAYSICTSKSLAS